MAKVIETVNLVDAEEVAGEIVKRLACNELSEEMGEAIRQAAKHGQYHYKSMVYVSNWGFCIATTLSPDGSLQFELEDVNGRKIWKTTLRPPARQVHVVHSCNAAAYSAPDDEY